MSKPGNRTIAFVGYDARCTVQALRQFAEDNAEHVACFDPYGMKMVLQDGTQILGMATRRIMDGLRIDQIIIADDARCRVWRQQSDSFAYLIHIRGMSDVPEEFAVQWYNLDAPAL
jgi:hypothetical protein